MSATFGDGERGRADDELVHEVYGEVDDTVGRLIEAAGESGCVVVVGGPYAAASTREPSPFYVVWNSVGPADEVPLRLVDVAPVLHRLVGRVATPALLGKVPETLAERFRNRNTLAVLEARPVEAPTRIADEALGRFGALASRASWRPGQSD